MNIKKCFALLFLSACGFSPMYSDKAFDVYIAPIDGTNGIDLRNALNGRFNSDNDMNAEYKLDIELKNPVTQYKAIESTGDANWQEVILNADYKLSKGDDVVLTGSTSASESYEFIEFLPAATASYNSAVRNAILILSDKISMRSIASMQE